MDEAADAPIVSITAGSVRGRWRRPAGALSPDAAFLGIPFAAPPVGERRFAAPAPVAPWEGVLDAAEHGATAQRGDTGITLIPEPSVPGESTLNVNVFTPRPGDPRARLPVVVYIHGGGFVSGSPASPWYDGASFSRDGVVTVVASYRLGFDGFGHVAGAPSNRGVRDWLAALEWVRADIAAFGGDPGRVTIAGQSAGGGAVLTLLAMPAASGLFQAAWAMSPAVVNVTPERARAVAARLAELAGVPATLEGFRSVPEDRLGRLQHAATAAASASPLGAARTLLEDGLPWGPEIDGDLIAQPTLAAIGAGAGGDTPLVIGATDDEFTMTLDRARAALRFVPPAWALARLGVPHDRARAYLRDNRPQRRKGTAAVLGRYVTDAVFRAGVSRTAAARGLAPTWVYRFSWPSPTKAWALHCLDVPFWFDRLDAEGVTAIAGADPPRSIAAALHGSAVALIRDGDPGWPAWSSRPGSTRVFAAPGAGADLIADGYADVRALC